MPKNTNILMIRHAEKPDSGKGLKVAGQERAQAYVIYFQNYSLGSNLLELDYLFASANSSASHRSRLTIQPLATALGLCINDTYTDTDYHELADLLQQPKYDRCNIRIDPLPQRFQRPDLRRGLATDPKRLQQLRQPRHRAFPGQGHGHGRQ